MVRVQDQQQVQGLDQLRVQFVRLGRQAEGEPHEVLHQVHGVVRVEHGLADALLVRVRRDHGELCHEANGGEFHLLLVKGIQGVLVEGGEGADGGGQHRHRVRVTRETAEEALEVLVQQRVAADPVVESLELCRGGQVAVDQQVGGFQEARVLGQLLDRVPAVAQDSGIAVDVGDRRGGGRGVHETGVESNGAGLLQQLRYVEAVVAFFGSDAGQLKLVRRVGPIVQFGTWSLSHVSPSGV